MGFPRPPGPRAAGLTRAVSNGQRPGSRCQRQGSHPHVHTAAPVTEAVPASSPEEALCAHHSRPTNSLESLAWTSVPKGTWSVTPQRDMVCNPTWSAHPGTAGTRPEHVTEQQSVGAGTPLSPGSLPQSPTSVSALQPACPHLCQPLGRPCCQSAAPSPGPAPTSPCW